MAALAVVGGAHGRLGTNVDVLVMGSGAAGLTGALRACHLGRSVLIVEKSDVWGGSAAMSAGALWVPNNPKMKAAGIPTTPRTRRCATSKSVTHGEIDEERLRALRPRVEPDGRLARGQQPRAFTSLEHYPDYDTDVDGSHGPAAARSTPCRSTATRAGRRVPHAARAVPGHADPGQVPDARSPRRAACCCPGSGPEARPGQGLRALPGARRPASGGVRPRPVPHHGAGADRPPASLADRPRRPAVAARSRRRRSSPRTAGSSASRSPATAGPSASRARRACWSRRAASSATTRCARSTSGRRSRSAGRSATTTTPATASAPARQVGGALDADAHARGLVDARRGAAGLKYTTVLVIEKSLPHGIFVTATGKRFVNEASNYNDVGIAMYETEARGEGAVPAWLIVDATYRKRFIIGPVGPGLMMPDKKLPAALAPGGGLAAPGRHARRPRRARSASTRRRSGPRSTASTRTPGAGVDPDFHRGRTANDRYYSDPRVQARTRRSDRSRRRPSTRSRSSRATSGRRRGSSPTLAAGCSTRRAIGDRRAVRRRATPRRPSWAARTRAPARRSRRR